MQYNLEVERLKTQTEVVVAAVNRGLADHHDVEFLIGEIRKRHVAKQLESASASASRRKRTRTRGRNGRGAPGAPKHGAAPRRPDPKPITTSSKSRSSPTNSVTSTLEATPNRNRGRKTLDAEDPRMNGQRDLADGPPGSGVADDEFGAGSGPTIPFDRWGTRR